MEGKTLGRFEIMALLQAARYYVLSKDIRKSFSFGLNRAIFYAWAKRRGRIQIKKPKTKTLKPIKITKEKEKIMVYVGDEGAFISDRGWFTIGKTEQRPEDFERQIITRINTIIPFEKAWKAAIEYVSNFSRSTLLDQQKFYEKVYKPVRDSFLQKIKEEEKTTKETTLTKFFKKANQS